MTRGRRGGRFRDGGHDGPELREVTLGISELPVVTVTVRRTSRSGTVRLNVADSGEVVVSAPPRLSGERIDRIVRERGAWLADVIGRIRLLRQATEVDLRRGDPVRLHGRWVPTQIQPVAGARGGCQLVDGRLVISLPHSGDPYALLHRWYRALARDVIEQRVDEWAARLSLRFGNITIRDQRTRWGSCTQRADLSFNWRLLLAPEWVMDAIIVHELCHIVELNHSSRFWALLDAAYPRHRDASAWLAEHGAALRMSAPASDPGVPAVAPVEGVPPRDRITGGRRRGRRRPAVSATQSELF
jgi:predicted metal-dependent hydrolase